MNNFQPLLDAGGVYLTGEDHLRLTTFGRIAGAIVALEGRLVTTDGKIVPIAETQTPNSDGTSKVTTFPLSEGVLTNVQLRASSGSVLGGGVFGILEVVRGLTANAQAMATLLQGYITTNARLAWPGSPILPSTTGAGRLRSITGTDPAANTEISETVPAGVRWRLMSFAVTLVSDANVANRAPVLIIDDGANQLFSSLISNAVAASSTIRLSWADVGFAGSGSSNADNGTLPPNLWLAAGFRIRTITSNIQAGDNYGAPQYLVEEFIE